jgi:hypothetical protein
MNLLTMALARLQDPEQILYMQRNYMRLEQTKAEQENQIRKLQGELKRKSFVSSIHELGVGGFAHE